jgi:hypothetical protein
METEVLLPRQQQPDNSLYKNNVALLQSEMEGFLGFHDCENETRCYD